MGNKSSKGKNKNKLAKKLLTELTKTTNFKKLQGTEFDVSAEHIWSQGDSLYKLSNRYYGEYQYWWTIGLTNSKPTDVHYSIGDVVYIPSNPYHIAELLK